MPFACAAKATQNGITAAIGASLQTSVLRTKNKNRIYRTEVRGFKPKKDTNKNTF